MAEGGVTIFRGIKHKKLLKSRGAQAAIKRVLGDSTFRDNAQKIQKVIRKIDGLSIAAGILEKAFDLEELRVSLVSCSLGDDRGRQHPDNSD